MSALEKHPLNNIPDHPLGLRLVEVSEESGTARVSFVMPPKYADDRGTVHPGFVIAMLDECMGVGIMTLMNGEFWPSTISLSSDFVRPIPLGRVSGEASLTSTSKKSCYLEARLVDEDGEIFAQSIGAYRIFPLPEELRGFVAGP